MVVVTGRNDCRCSTLTRDSPGTSHTVTGSDQRPPRPSESSSATCPLQKTAFFNTLLAFMMTTVFCYSAILGANVTDYGTPFRVDMGNVGSNMAPYSKSKRNPMETGIRGGYYSSGWTAVKTEDTRKT